jgi:hypothetical protein
LLVVCPLNSDGELLLESYKFWRIYGGVKFSYSLYNRSQFSDDLSIVEITNNKDFNKFLYGLLVGYNTVNVYAYYGLNSILKQIDGEKINMKAFNIGIIFMYYSHKYNNSICGMLPKDPIISSLEVCAFITKREEATKPFIMVRKNA